MAEGEFLKNLSLKATLDGTEEVYINDSGTDKKTTIQWIKDFISGVVNSIKFVTSYDPVSTVEGEVWWNGKFHTIRMNTGLNDDIVNLGQDQFYVFYNDTGSDIQPFRVMHLKSATSFGGELYPTFELADPRDWEKVQGTLAVTCCVIPDGELGVIFRTGQKIKGGDTSGIPAGSQLWLAADGTGSFTDAKPAFQDYVLSIGGSYNSVAAPDGEILLSLTGSIEDDFHNAWDGGIRETFNFTTSSNGTIVTGLLENVINTRNLTCFFSDVGRYTLDTTTAPLTIELIAGADYNTQTNYVYVPISTKALTVSTSGFPTTEHCKIALLEVQTAANVQLLGGTRRNQNINDHIKKEDDNGHVLHIAERIRQLNAQWDNGTEATLDDAGGNGYISITGGQVWQMHKQSVPVFSMPTQDILVVNDDVTPYLPVNTLSDIDEFSDGSNWSGSWGKVVIWSVANKTGEPSFSFVNIPREGYNTELRAIEDRDNHTDYTIPDKYKGVGFLVASFVYRRSSGGTITYNGADAYTDLRGFVPNNTAGGGGGGGGVTTWLALTDTFSSYAGRAKQATVVNAGETGLDSVPIASRQRQTLAEVVTNIPLDWDSLNDLISTNRVAIAANRTFTYVNATNAEFCTFKVEITNTATLTFPSGSVSSDPNWDTLVWTPPSNGKFTISIYKTSTEYEVLFTQIAAV
jgi:hypothetical protein